MEITVQGTQYSLLFVLRHNQYRCADAVCFWAVGSIFYHNFFCRPFPEQKEEAPIAYDTKENRLFATRPMTSSAPEYHDSITNDTY